MTAAAPDVKIPHEGCSGPPGAGAAGPPAPNAVLVWDWFQPGPEVPNGDGDGIAHAGLPSLDDLHDRGPQPGGGLLTTATERFAPTSTIPLSSLERACLCARVAADNKARDVLVLDMRGITPL